MVDSSISSQGKETVLLAELGALRTGGALLAWLARRRIAQVSRFLCADHSGSFPTPMSLRWMG